MGQIKITIAMVLVFISLVSFSQKNDSAKARLNHYTFTIGAGWTHFINNLENGDQNIKQDFAGISLKFFWEPEHRLCLGLETGYYKLFKVKGQLTDNTTGEVDRSVLPFLLLARMRIIDNVYLGTGVGLAIIYNKISGGQQKIVTKTTSLSNFEFSGAYIYPLSKHWLVGGEFKVINFGNLDDNIYSIQATCGLKL